MLKTASKLIHNWRCYPSSKCCKIDQKHGSELGVLLWCHLTPQKNKSNVGAHLTLSGVQSYCGKFASCMTFDVHKRVVPSHFWTTFTKFDTCCWRYVATCGNFFSTSTFWALNHCSGILLIYFCYLYKVLHTTFLSIFRLHNF